MRDTLLADRELSEGEANVVRSLYYENRLLLEDVADILGAREAMRVYMLKSSIESDSFTGETPVNYGDGDFRDEIPEEIPDSVIDDISEKE